MTNESTRFGFILPGGSARQQLEQAVLAEQAGWDGVFVFETAYGVDAWGLLSAIAAATSRIRLGTMLTPLPWRRPWKLASQVATLDDLSAGRAVVGLGLGAVDPVLPSAAGDVTDRKQRAAMLDEGIDLMRALWHGDGSYQGEHYSFRGGSLVDGALAPVQNPIPVWAVGAWPRPRSMNRILRCDGVIPEYQLGEGRRPTPGDLRELIAWLAERGATGLDVVHEGETGAGDRAAAIEAVAPWSEAGATWWLESRWGGDQHGEQKRREVTARLEAGPPRG
ncbi:LLM class flavin-dependent oxidoreductase [Kineosporia sp. J2-2]|uniref:LLM class flavin-dependent oxidoreductase n=1 Tax=Kineosporia corallincola TaxID=2835133 RepID=A0ABS5TLL8_9ACTN|nr:LLM class flavin-dependent oxidoreductase [Kineosporia corallincola]MBT0771990.1 LLM class flavin-dependent oxidoreductase [Kineosporia corallincola]